MEIFVGNVSPKTRSSELKAFFKGFDKDARFDVVRLKGDYDTVVFGYVVIPSERLARKAIRKLHLKVLGERRVIVREFHHRAAGNDRRELSWRLKPWQQGERRGTDRRVKRRNIKEQEITISGYSNLARKNV